MAGGVRGIRASVTVRVPAKINLFLAIRGIRDDGYHELVSVMQTVGLYDEVRADLLANPNGNGSALHPATLPFMHVEFEHDAGAALPDGDDNLVFRAAARLSEVFGGDGHGHHGERERPDGPVTRVHLRKRIPVAAGMAGGSADAAATLVALDSLWDCNMTRDELRELAAELGADVPFCVTGDTALATGIGTATAHVISRGTYHWVVGASDRPLPTPDVYRVWDEIGEVTEVEPDAVLQALRTGDPEALGAALYNDLEIAAIHLRPEIAAGREAMLDAGCLGAIVTGSGPTVVGLAPDQLSAQRVAAAVADHFDRVEVASSPAGGPEVIARA